MFSCYIQSLIFLYLLNIESVFFALDYQIILWQLLYTIHEASLIDCLFAVLLHTQPALLTKKKSSLKWPKISYRTSKFVKSQKTTLPPKMLWAEHCKRTVFYGWPEEYIWTNHWFISINYLHIVHILCVFISCGITYICDVQDIFWCIWSGCALLLPCSTLLMTFTCIVGAK